MCYHDYRSFLSKNDGWLCFTSHRQRGHLETAPIFTVPCEGREAWFLHRSHYTTAAPRQLLNSHHLSSYLLNIDWCYWSNKSPNIASLKWKFKQYEYIALLRWINCEITMKNGKSV